MKKLIVLPGNSERNRAWGEGAVAGFGSEFDEVYMQTYDHWGTGSKEMNVEAELAKLQNVVRDTGCEYYVLAKSIGSLLALLSIHRSYFIPQRCVFFGMPLDLANQGLFKDDWSPLSSFSVPSLAYHNVEDPTANFSFTKNKILEMPDLPIELIELPGNTHDYLDFADYVTQIKNFFKL